MSETLRFADELDELNYVDYPNKDEAAAELRRLHEANQAMLEALRPFANYACDEPCSCHNCAARTAIAKGEAS